MSKMIFVNLPVQDLERTRAFFTALGFTFNPQFSDENALGMVIDEDNGIHAMLLLEPFFKTFTPKGKEIADATRTTETIIALSAESRAEVDDLAERALANGGSPANEPMDEGFMYGRSFQDPDGHVWEVVWMDPAAMESAGS
ncbi:VOC family protein [Streptomyces sp. JJ36]|uniref:VOC family protein n=1 Tax=Streptomyces sp. JJ36 TaxID=2736645 RepID=UPI001F45EBE0|nr:VOC family protein [Streptomyces sp. JJ36]MCF6522699.1 VOC family protein [Streptomyces sp. JJ36]